MTQLARLRLISVEFRKTPPHAQIVSRKRIDDFVSSLSDNMLDFQTHYSELDALRERVKQHLGPDCFFDYQARFKRTYRVPNVGWEEPPRPPLRPDDPGKPMTGAELIQLIRDRTRPSSERNTSSPPPPEK